MSNQPVSGSREIRTKFTTKCGAGCIYPIRKDEKCWYVPSEKKVYHFSCAPKYSKLLIGQCDVCGNGYNSHTRSCTKNK